jgi:Na+-driven multidrug efflux pump
VDRLLYRDFFRYGVPIVAGDLQWGLVGTFKSMIIGRLGPAMISANSITDLVLSLGAIFTSGLSSAACVIIGKTVGVSDYKRTREYSGTIQILFVAVGVLMMAIVFLTRPFAVSFYNVSDATRTLALQMLAIGAITMLGTTYHAACFTGINRGAGDSRFVFKVDMICGWLIVLPLTALAAFVLGWPLPVVFLFTRIDQCFKWLIALIRLRGNKWIHNVTRSEPYAAGSSCDTITLPENTGEGL